VLAEAGNDQIRTGAGQDLVLAGLGDDQVASEAGEDTVYGGGADTFVLAYGEGGDSILDFGAGPDRLGLAGTLRFDQLTIRQTGSNTVIQFQEATLATLVGVTAPLTEASFVRLPS
jgi:Ca2+-binding RTX toxin-like protein